MRNKNGLNSKIGLPLLVAGGADLFSEKKQEPLDKGITKKIVEAWEEAEAKMYEDVGAFIKLSTKEHRDKSCHRNKKRKKRK